MTTALIATTKPQLEAAQQVMIEWCDKAIADCRQEEQEQITTIGQASRHGWNVRTYENRLRTVRRRIVFYEKVQAAVKAGYVIVPNFRLDLFAVRTTKSAPNQVTRSRYSDFDEPAKLLPAGEGAYVDPRPVGEHSTTTEKRPNGSETTEHWFTPTEFKDIEFPIALAEPVLMEATGEAMALRLFDEIGVAQDADQNRRPDPIIVGRVRNPRRGRPDVSFFLGWLFDPSRL